MADSGAYSCRVSCDRLEAEAECMIGGEALSVRTKGGGMQVDYSDLSDIRLIDYRVVLETAGGKVEISSLGRQTEDFFENLWEAYGERSREALFVASEPLYAGEGDYAYTEQGFEAHGIAKVALYPDCLCIFPHDDRARRIPLCFADAPEAADFWISLRLDTGDIYRVGRMGRSFDAVSEKIVTLQQKVAQRWRKAHKELADDLSARLGADAEGYRRMESLGCRMVTGLYSLEDESFWFAGIRDGKAAVEWVTQEQTATYLYTFDTDEAVFERSLRHALESAALHREVIYTDLDGKPLYRMTVRRSYHLRFLRDRFAGRIIHNSSWPERLWEFFGM